MNPFNLSGPEFLWLYALVYAAVFAFAVYLRFALRQPSDSESLPSHELAPYEVAYLVDGPSLAVKAAIARLVRDHVLSFDPKSRLIRQAGQPPGRLSEPEFTVFEAAKSKSGIPVSRLLSWSKSACDSLRDSLQQRGLIVADDQARLARFVPLLAVLSVIAMGVVKIFVGISRDKPVAILVVLCILSGFAALLAVGRSVHRSRLGDAVVKRLRQDHVALKSQAGQRINEIPAHDFVYGMSLYGMALLAGSSLAPLKSVLMPPQSSGTGAGGGGGCGGGGCGGGGCGGGGCGGCGS